MTQSQLKETPATESRDARPPAPYFSIGVTTYDRPELLKQTLLSITRQTFSDFEVIVGNDYIAGPLSAKLLGIHDPRIRFENYPQNLGEARNMNTLLDMSRGQYFTWQCDDDLYTPTFLEEVFSSLTKFNNPPCVFTSHNKIYGISSPNTAKPFPGQGQSYSGRQFLRLYWSGKLKAMGCTGVYQKTFLQELGGVQCLADSHHPLYSEHLLLIQVALQEQVVHIDKPLVLYRIHEDAWGCSTNDLLLYKQACEKLLNESISVFKQPELRGDFSQNIGSVLKFVVSEFFNKAKSHSGLLSRFKVLPFFCSLKKQFNSLRGTVLYWKALVIWCWTGVNLAWWLSTDFNFKAAISPVLSKIAHTLRSYIGRHE